jgi:hypothetical protein
MNGGKNLIAVVKAVGSGDEYPDLKVLGLLRYSERLVGHQHKKIAS